jgi:hypothetical protein
VQASRRSSAAFFVAAVMLPALAQAQGLAPLPVVEGAERQFLTQCRDDLVRRDANAAGWADQDCRNSWGKIVAAGLAADFFLASVPASGRLSIDAIKALPGATWFPKVQRPLLAAGEIGGLTLMIEGQRAPASISGHWDEQAGEIPYDIAGAMRVRGVTLTVASCESSGSGAGVRTYAGTAPGRAPFTLTVDEQTAPLGHMQSYYDATISLDGRHPPRGATADCDF